MEELYQRYGYYSNYLKSYEFEGSQGFKKMQDIMEMFRNDVKEINGQPVSKKLDYNQGIDGLPKSNVIKMYFSNGMSIVARPSGTEPKLKIYLSIKGNSLKDNDLVSEQVFNEINQMVK